MEIKSTTLSYLSLFFLSASIICFEIISTRISSVVFVNDYAFIILSLAILGLGSGGIFSYYNIKGNNILAVHKIISTVLFLFGASLFIFIVTLIKFLITNPFIYFFLLFLPFFFAGIIYAQIYKTYAEQSFKLYAFDLSGAAVGSFCDVWFLRNNSSDI